MREDGAAWVLGVRRTGTFPADERDRYASRLRRIVQPYGGRYETFLPDARVRRTAGTNTERTAT